MLKAIIVGLIVSVVLTLFMHWLMGKLIPWSIKRINKKWDKKLEDYCRERGMRYEKTENGYKFFKA